MLSTCYSINAHPSAKCVGDCVKHVCVCRVCMRLCGSVGVRRSALQSSERQMAAQSHLSCSTGPLVFGSGSLSCLGRGITVIPTVPYSTHIRKHTHTNTHLEVSELLLPCGLTELPTLR